MVSYMNTLLAGDKGPRGFVVLTQLRGWSAMWVHLHPGQLALATDAGSAHKGVFVSGSWNIECKLSPVEISLYDAADVVPQARTEVSLHGRPVYAEL